MEIWKPVVGFENIYSVSNFGRVRREKTLRILKPNLWRNTYPSVLLSNKSIHKKYRIHVIVTRAFLGQRPKGTGVNHKDGVKTNNRLENLEYISPSENSRHAVNLGLIPAPSNYLWASTRTQCKRGHALIPSNIYVDSRGARNCRECCNSRARYYWRKNHSSLPILDPISLAGLPA